ncbi:MAG: IPT/TIG domain-containing protein [Candidatus Dormibacterales bacterium]
MLARRRHLPRRLKDGAMLGVVFLLLSQAVGSWPLAVQGSAPGVTESFGAASATATTALAASAGSATGAGDLLVATVKVRDTTSMASVGGVSDSAGNTWTRAAGATAGTQADGEIWYASGAASVNTVTVTTTAVSALAFTVLDISGASPSPLDATASLGGSGSSASTGTTSTTSQASEIAVGEVGWNGSVSPGGQTAGYTATTTRQSTAKGEATGEQAAWQVLSSTGTQAYGATLSGSVAWTGVIATFKVGSPVPPPVITKFSPTAGTDGASVIITGSGFTGATQVAFNGTAQPAFSVGTDAQITTSVPTGATSGTISVTGPGGKGTSSTSFAVQPSITGFTPTSGTVGAGVTINGHGMTGATQVAFNGTAQTAFTVSGDSSISTTVPSGATSGTISVTTPGGAATSAASFAVNSSPVPTITKFAPTSGSVGATVVISGTGFTGASHVSFNGTAQTTYSVDSDTQISTSVPTGASTGTISVTTPGGTAHSSSSFTVTAPPTTSISKFSPTSGPVGTTVVITGSGFTGTTAVSFNGTPQTVYSVDSDTQISTSVPTGATTGTISVTAPGGKATSSTAFTVTAAAGPAHVMLIVMENKAYSSKQGSPYVIGSRQAPYINNTLVPDYTSATHWYAVEHNSPRDYLDLISGSNQNLGLGGTRPFSATTLVDELNTSNLRWKAYMESMPNTPCYVGPSTTLYYSDHNPFAYFKDYKSLCDGKGDGVFSYSGPFSGSQMQADLNSAAPPAFVWFSPNICDDMHTNGGPCGPNGVANGDSWLKTFIPAVQSTTWYQGGGIIIVTWDESIGKDTSGGSYGTGGQVPTLVISGHPRGAYSTAGDHYATLRGIEEEYGVPLLGHSANLAYGDLKTAF